MNKTTRKLIVTAAITGLLSGVAVNRSYSRDDSTNAPPAAGKQAPARKVPKVAGCSGQNDCKGIGGCKTSEHECKFKNSCKGKGGCSITEQDVKDWEKAHPADSKGA